VKLFQHARKTKSEILFDIFIYGLAICLILLIVYPLWFVIIASFSNPSDCFNMRERPSQKFSLMFLSMV